VAWGLEQTRYFTQGCDNLVVVTDHKPLVKIFGDRTLDEITNSRLFRLKQRTSHGVLTSCTCLARATMPRMQPRDIRPPLAQRTASHSDRQAYLMS
jgi:hypothetical protein